MTYCVGLCLKDGLLFASDSRTNAGVDYVTTYSKMHIFTPAPDRLFVLLAAGSLATTQEIINYIQRDLAFPDGKENLLSSRYLFEAAEYIARVSQTVLQNHSQTLQQSGISGDVTLILGGQIQGQPHGLMMIYPQGGETKYGKPVLDRLLKYDTPLNDAARLALVSLTSTANSNITVGPPFEVAVYNVNQFQLTSHCRFEPNGKFLKQLESSWKNGLKSAFDSLPRFEWENDTNEGTGNSRECEATPPSPPQEQPQVPEPVLVNNQKTA